MNSDQALSLAGSRTNAFSKIHGRSSISKYMPEMYLVNDGRQSRKKNDIAGISEEVDQHILRDQSH